MGDTGSPMTSALLVERLARRLHAEVVQTHISWILLLPGGVAYKLKKPVRLPFVDYSTLERRRHFCEEEVRLNARLAPSLYLGVSRITGTPEAPEVDGPGDTLDYAVRMQRFPAGALWSEQVDAGTLDAAAVDRFAIRLARFHAAAPQVSPPPGTPPDLPLRRALAALAGAAPVLPADAGASVTAWLRQQWAGLQQLAADRAAQGRVRECHGDLHLANIVTLGEEVVAFDCIEFDATLRSIDVVDDVAFAFMDFAARGRPDLGWRFLNAWVEELGDHGALPLLRFCTVGRALVRAQVEHLRAAGSEAAVRYARAAVEWTQPAAPRLYITHGLPGSGKTFASQRLLERVGAVRIRSDVERKRLFGLDPLADSRALGLELYTPAVTQRTYERLFLLARTVLRGGISVVLDAAFLRHAERDAARALAAELGVPYAILACEAPLPVLRQRLQARRGDASEADASVLDQLAAAAQPLRADEPRLSADS